MDLQKTPYSDKITLLEEKGIVEIMPTQSIMATDPRKFRLKVTMDQSRVEYNTSYYDVDCLGSNLHYDLTQTIERLFRIYY